MITSAIYADFYALMPPDNTSTIAPGIDISFPQDNTSSAGITRTSNSSLTFLKLELIL